MGHPPKGSSLFTAYFILFVDNLGFSVVFPILPFLFSHPSLQLIPENADAAFHHLLLGLILAAYPLGQFFGAPFFGDIADRYGRKKTLFWTLTGTLIGYCFTALGIYLKLFSLIFLSRLFTGFFGATLSLCLAILADLNPLKKERAKFISWASSCLALSWISSILLGFLFTNAKNLHALNPAFFFLAIGALNLLSLLSVLFFYRETAPHAFPHRLDIFKTARNLADLLESKVLRILFFTFFFWFFGFFLSLQWLAPMATDYFQANEMTLFGILICLGIFWALSSGFLTPVFIRYFSLWKVTLWTLFLTSLFFFFSAASNFLPYFVGAYLVGSAFAAVVWPSSMSLVSFSSSPHDQGKSLGLAQSTQTLAQILAPFFGGLIAGVRLKGVFYASSLFVFLSFLLLLIYVLRRSSKVRI